MTAILFIVAAPSGAGKSSLVNAAIAADPRLKLSVSYTTRAPRAGELEGREYHFVDRPTFFALRDSGEFLESAEVHGNFYATSKRQIEANRAAGLDIVLEIDWQGARQVRALFADTVSIFILPPSMTELERRLRARGKDAEAVIARRLAAARTEIEHAPEFDYAIINKDFDDARADLAAVIRAARLTSPRQRARHPEVF
jgi:guanylate kinase